MQIGWKQSDLFRLNPRLHSEWIRSIRIISISDSFEFKFWIKPHWFGLIFNQFALNEIQKRFLKLFRNSFRNVWDWLLFWKLFLGGDMIHLHFPHESFRMKFNPSKSELFRLFPNSFRAIRTKFVISFGEKRLKINPPNLFYSDLIRDFNPNESESIRIISISDSFGFKIWIEWMSRIDFQSICIKRDPKTFFEILQKQFSECFGLASFSKLPAGYLYKGPY